MDTDNTFSLEDILIKYIYYASQMKSRVDKRIMKEFVESLITMLGLAEESPTKRFIGLITQEEQESNDKLLADVIKLQATEGFEEFLLSHGFNKYE